MREWITTGGELAGSALVALGCFQYSHSLGYVVMGTCIALFSWLAAR